MKHFICAIFVITLVACDQPIVEKTIIADKSDSNITFTSMAQKASLPTVAAASPMSNVLFKGLLLNSTDIAINGKQKSFLCVTNLCLTFLIKRFFSTLQYHSLRALFFH